jgi:hypothetical protein
VFLVSVYCIESSASGMEFGVVKEIVQI